MKKGSSDVFTILIMVGIILAILPIIGFFLLLRVNPSGGEEWMGVALLGIGSFFIGLILLLIGIIGGIFTFQKYGFSRVGLATILLLILFGIIIYLIKLNFNTLFPGIPAY